MPRIDGRFATVGTVAQVDQAGELPNGVPALILRGLHRATLGSGATGTGAALWINVEPVNEPAADSHGPRVRELAQEYRALITGIAERRHSRRMAEMLRGVTDPSALADTAGSWPDLALARKVELLETIDVEARLEKVVAWAREALAELEIEEQIRTDVTEGMEKAQREFLLRQQLNAIRKELGDLDESTNIADQYRAKLVELTLPDAVRTAVDKEIDRFERTSEQSPEHGWIRTWLDTLLELPWGIRSDDRLDVVAARAILDADHTGLADVKDRIIEHLAVKKLRIERDVDATDATTATAPTKTVRGDGTILALVGPPGVGKTSLGESIARALDRKFVRVALWRGARRGRDPWPPPHVCRRHARPPGPRHEGGGDDESRHPA